MKRNGLPNAMLIGVAGVSILATAVITAAVLARQTVRAAHAAEPLPVYFDLPTFELVDHHDRPFGSSQLAGKVWVADFMFTRCTGICPMLSANMRALQDALQGKPYWSDVRLVSISVDADHDTPDVLRAYARRFGAEEGRWYFLHGPRETVWSLSEEGFRLTVAEAPDDEAMPISHSGRFAVVDRRGRVRAYHDGTDPASRAALVADIERLMAEP
jgi:protein SCO1/2